MTRLHLEWFRSLESKLGTTAAALLVTTVGLIIFLLGYMLGMWIV